MKVNYTNYPVLEKIQNGRFGRTEYPVAELKFFMGKEFKFFNDHWKKDVSFFKKEINYLTVPYMEAVGIAGNKLLDLYKDIIESKEHDLNCDGTFIEADGFTYTIKYDFKKENGNHFILLYWFEGNRLFGCYYCDAYPYNSKIWISGDYKKSFNIDTVEKEVREASDIVSRLILYKLFKSYAEVETKHLLPNTVESGVDCKYVNDTKLPITYLDSK